MAEDLLDLGSFHRGSQKSAVSQSLPMGESSGSVPSTSSHASNLADLWGMSAPASPSTTAIPRFTEAPPASPSLAVFPPVSSSGSQSSQHSSSPSSVSSGSTGSAMLQLQDLWYAPSTTKTPSKLAVEHDSSSSPAPTSVLPPVMSPSPPSSNHTAHAEPQTAQANTQAQTVAHVPANASSSGHVPSEHTEKVHMLPASAYVAEKPLSTSTSLAPPFPVWSPAAESTSSPSLAPSTPEPSSGPKYHVTTVAAPPGSVESESLGVMKDMLRTMSDMTRRMLNMEERISRLEMEKEQLARTVNRLQEAQHQMAVRQEVPKPVTVSTAGYPPGFPPGYTAITSTYNGFPPGYGVPASNVVPGRPR